MNDPTDKFTFTVYTLPERLIYLRHHIDDWRASDAVKGLVMEIIIWVLRRKRNQMM